MTPTLSVVTVCFNAQATIADTLRSVSGQTCEEYEHLIIDGSSSDGTCRIVESLRTSRTRLVSEPDRGLYDAMNKGLALAQGEFTCFLNADDTYAAPDTLARVCAALRRGTIDLAYGDIEFVAHGGSARVTRRWRAGRYSRQLVELGWHPPHPGFFARTSVLRSVGGFCLDLPIAADYEVMLKVLLQPNLRVEYVERPLVRMREGGRSTKSVASYLSGGWQSFRAMRRNGLPHPTAAVFFKPLRKVAQFLPRIQRSGT